MHKWSTKGWSSVLHLCILKQREGKYILVDQKVNKPKPRGRGCLKAELIVLDASAGLIKHILFPCKLLTIIFVLSQLQKWHCIIAFLYSVKLLMR